ncbi:MAG TPA: hypothetical protein VNU93_05490, partial [Verrucomicrobiae bacterium]|nr:hypothetical protein [Verrucomicrobiae bacterium]
MQLKPFRLPIILAVILLTALAAAAFAFAADPMPGAIWTTDYLGHVVNGNVIYESKPDVYLNGGPDKSGKLPDGMYYIQVTEPDGTLLGTTVGGKWGPQTYEVKDGEFVNGLIQLFQATRFKTTTNPGGEYKVWVSTDSKFPSSLSKTDNFKVKKQYWGNLIVRKFNDLDNSGTWGTTSEPLITWNVTIKDITDPANPAPMIWEQT